MKSMEGECYLRSDLLQYKTASNLQFNEHIKSLQKGGVNIHHLGFGQSPFPVPAFAQKNLQKYAHAGQYLPIRGLPELREAICQLHRQEDELHHFLPSDVVVGPGSKELIFLLLTVIDGDVLLLSPTWTTYKPQALLTKHRVIKLPTHYEEGWKVTPQQLDKTFHQEMIKENSLLILCNPDNPTGAAYTKTELETLSAKFRERKLLVVSDEIYSRLSFNNNHCSLAKYYPEGTVLSSGISKWASCGGWRLGYHMFPSQLKALSNAVASAASQSYTSASAPIQYAAVSLLRFGDEAREYTSHCKRILLAVAKHCCQSLRKVGVKVHFPSSGYYIFPDFEVIRNELADRGIKTGSDMCSAMLKEVGVAVMAGGPAYLHSADELTVRLCYINFDGEYALKGSEEIGLDKPLPANFVQEYCSPTVEAIELIVGWVSQLRRSSKCNQ